MENFQTYIDSDGQTDVDTCVAQIERYREKKERRKGEGETKLGWRG